MTNHINVYISRRPNCLRSENQMLNFLVKLLCYIYQDQCIPGRVRSETDHFTSIAYCTLRAHPLERHSTRVISIFLDQPQQQKNVPKTFTKRFMKPLCNHYATVSWNVLSTFTKRFFSTLTLRSYFKTFWQRLGNVAATF